MFKDDALLELASTKPKTPQDLSRSRLLLREARKGDIAAGILEAIEKASNYAAGDYPRVDNSRDKLQVNPALADMLRVLLKAKSDRFNVAAKMIASTADLDRIAAGQRELPALKGWRAEVFGQDALRLCAGEVGLAVKGQKVDVIAL